MSASIARIKESTAALDVTARHVEHLEQEGNKAITKAFETVAAATALPRIPAEWRSAVVAKNTAPGSAMSNTISCWEGGTLTKAWAKFQVVGSEPLLALKFRCVKTVKDVPTGIWVYEFNRDAAEVRAMAARDSSVYELVGDALDAANTDLSKSVPPTAAVK